jgi:hypothetical protein
VSNKCESILRCHLITAAGSTDQGVGELRVAFGNRHPEQVVTIRRAESEGLAMAQSRRILKDLWRTLPQCRSRLIASAVPLLQLTDDLGDNLDRLAADVDGDRLLIR